MRRPEQAIQISVVAHLKRRAVPACVWWHTPSGAFYGKNRFIWGGIMKQMGARAGVPDLLLFHNGQLYCLELKSARGSVTASQRQFMLEIGQAGAICKIADGIDLALETLRDWGLIR